VREQQWRAKLDSGDLVFCLLLEGEGGLVGFASGERHRDEPHDYGGELNKIYVLRDYQGRGLGRHLLCASANRFLACGIRSMLLFGDAASSSNGFYEARGGQRLRTATGDFHGAYGWPDLTVLTGPGGRDHAAGARSAPCHRPAGP